ncbi:MAG: hypothetical protein PVH88_02815 [Ignavibacteria bacterium]|jgi:hypothetical protein
MEHYKYNDEFPPERNIAIALFGIANELRRLGFNDAVDVKMGAIEGLSVFIKEGFEEVARSIEILSESKD